MINFLKCWKRNLGREKLILIKALLLIIVLLILFVVWGIALRLSFKFEGRLSLIGTLLQGMPSYFSVFFLIGLPLKILQVRLSVIAVIWVLFNVVVLIYTLLVGRRWYGQLFTEIRKVIFSHGFVVAGCVAVIFLQLAFVEIQGNEGSPWDSSYYIGEVASDVYYDEAGTVDAYTGERLDYFSLEYFFETAQLHHSVMCRITGLPALVEVRTSWLGVAAILYNLVMCRLAFVLFRKTDWKIPVFTAGMFIVNLFSTSIYWPGQFLLLRGFEGKTFLANIIIPLLLTSFIQLYQKEKQETWIGLFLVMFISFTFSMSAIFLIPVFIFGYGLILMIRKYTMVCFRNLLVCLLPCLVVGGVYFAQSKGFLLIPVR